jgi:hypothetical protein
VLPVLPFLEKTTRKGCMCECIAEVLAEAGIRLGLVCVFMALRCPVSMLDKVGVIIRKVHFV